MPVYFVCPGKGTDDQVIGGHADIVINRGKSYIFYFTHPGRAAGAQGRDTRRSSISRSQNSDLMKTR
jgi:hypothetical protein